MPILLDKCKFLKKKIDYLRYEVSEAGIRPLSKKVEAIKKFPTWDGDDSANWKKVSGIIKKFITDSNAIAQEKGLEATLAYVENCDAAGRVASDAIEGVVAKCLGAPKVKKHAI